MSMVKRIARRCIQSSELNLDRQEYRAMKEMAHYLRIDPSKFKLEEAKRVDAGFERWSHPKIQEIVVHIVKYAPDGKGKSNYSGHKTLDVRGAGHLLHDGRGHFKYDVDGLIKDRDELGGSIFEAEIEEMPGLHSFSRSAGKSTPDVEVSLPHYTIAGYIEYLDNCYQLERVVLNGKELSSPKKWSQSGNWPPSNVSDIQWPPVEFEYQISEMGIPISFEKTPEEMISELRGIVHSNEYSLEDIDFLKIEGQEVDLERWVHDPPIDVK